MDSLFRPIGWRPVFLIGVVLAWFHSTSLAGQPGQPPTKEQQEKLASLQQLAGLHERKENYRAAIQARQEILQIKTKLHGEDHWQVIDARVALQDSQFQAKLEPADRSSLREARTLNGQVYKLWRQGKYRDAILAAQKALTIRRRILGDNHHDYAQSLLGLATLLETLRQSQKAEPLFRKGLAIAQGVFGKEHPKCAMILNNLGALYKRQGKFDQARQIYEEAVEINKKALGEDDPQYAESLNSLAMLHFSQARYDQAKPLLEQSLAIKKQALGDKNAGYATTLNNLAMLHHQLAEYAKAKPLYEQALVIHKQVLGEKHPTYATTLNNLANLHQKQGDYAGAEPLYKQALAIRKQALGEKHPYYAQSLNNLAGLHKDQGELALAEPLLRQAVAIAKETVGEKHPGYARSLNNLAMLYSSNGKFAQAEPLLQTALSIRKKVLGVKHPSYANTLNSLASFYHDQGDFEQAGPLYRQALTIQKDVLGEEHPGYAITLNNLAALHKEQGEFVKAEQLYRQALAVYKDTLGEKHPTYAVSLTNLAIVLADRGSNAQVQEMYQNALAINKRVLGEYHPAFAGSLTNLGKQYWLQGDLDRAEPLFRQALAIYEQALGKEHPRCAFCLTNIAQLYRSRGEVDQALPVIRRVLDITRHHLDLTAVAQSERQQLRMTALLRFRLDYYLTVARESNHSGASVHEQVLAWKGAISARQQRLRVQRSKPELAALVAQLRSVSTRLATLAFAVPEPAQRAAFQRQILELTKQREQLEKDLASKNSAFHQVWETARLTPRELQKSLPANTVLVDFLEYTRRSSNPNKLGSLNGEVRLAAFVVRPLEADVVFLDLGPMKPIANAIKQWREMVSRRTRPIMNDHDPALFLQQCLWKPLEPHLNGAKVVLVSPDGGTAALPFVALPGSQPNRFLIEERFVVTLPVPQLLPQILEKRREPDPAAAPSLLLVGDVDYGAPSGQANTRSGAPAPGRRNWSHLQGTKAEIHSIHRAFEQRFPDGKTHTLNRTEATESAVKEAASGQQYLHLATHGFFADDKLRSALMQSETDLLRSGHFGKKGIIGFHPGLLSGLVLAGANHPIQTGQNDGIMTALEVAELDLGQVELAVLSACETGLGQVAGGEGLLGLQRAFQVAGARNVIASLWQVNDGATAALMALFYHKLWNEDKPAMMALREAQLTLMYHPEMIENLAQKRGVDFDELARLPMAAPQGDPKSASTNRAAVDLWAGFTLSGLGTADRETLAAITVNEIPAPPASVAPVEELPAPTKPASSWHWPVAAGVIVLALLGTIWLVSSCRRRATSA